MLKLPHRPENRIDFLLQLLSRRQKGQKIKIVKEINPTGFIKTEHSDVLNILPHPVSNFQSTCRNTTEFHPTSSLSESSHIIMQLFKRSSLLWVSGRSWCVRREEAVYHVASVKRLKLILEIGSDVFFSGRCSVCLSKSKGPAPSFFFFLF